MAGLPDWMQFDTSKLPTMDPSAPPPPQGSTTANPFVAGIKSGVRSALGEGASAFEAIGKTLGANEFAAKAAEAAKEQQDAATRAGRSDLEGGIGQAWDQGKILPWTAYQVTKGLPQLGVMLGGGALAAAAAPGVAGAGAIGMGIAGLPSAAGELQQAVKGRAQAEGREETQGEAGAALLGSPLLAAINTVVPGGIENIIAKGAGGDIARRVLTSGGVMAAYGAPQAALSTAYEQQFGAPKSMAERSHEIVDAALGGAVTGGVMGGAFGAAFKSKKPSDITNEELGQNVDQATKPLALPPPAEGAPANPADVIQMGGEGQRVLGGPEKPAGLLPPPLEEPVVPGSDNAAIPMGDAMQRDRFLTDQHANDGEYLGEAPPQTALPGPNEPAGLVGHLPGIMDEAGQYEMPNLPKDVPHPDRPHAGMSDEALVEDLNSLRDKHINGGGLSPAEMVHGQRLFDEYEQRHGVKNEPDDAEHTPDLPGVAAHNASVDRDLQVAQTRASVAKEIGDKRVTNVLKGIDAEDKPDLRNKVADLLSETTKPKAALVKLADHLGIMDRDQNARDLGKELNTLDKQKDDIWKTAKDSATATKQEAPIVAKMKQLNDLIDLKRQADMRRKEDAAKAAAPEETENVPASKDVEPTTQEGRDAAGRQEQRAPAEGQSAERQGQGKPLRDRSEREEAIDEQWQQISKGQEPAPAPVPAQEVAPPPVDVVGQQANEAQRINDRIEQQRAKQAADWDALNKATSAKKSAAAARNRAGNAMNKATEKETQLASADEPKPVPIDTVAKQYFASRSADPVERATQHDAAIRSIVENGGHAGHVLDFIAKTSDNPLIRNIAAAVKRMGVKSKIDFNAQPVTKELNVSDAAKQRPMPAFYEPHLDRIGSDGTNLERNILHESVHAATHAAIEAGGPAAQRIKDLYEAAQKRLGYKDEYGLENLHEFVAEALTNRSFQKLLSGIKGLEPKKSMWQSFKDGLFKMLKIGESNRSMLDDVIEAGHKLMDEQQRLGQDRVTTAGRIHSILSGKNADRPSSPVEADAHVQYFASRATEASDEILKTASTHGWASLKNFAQKAVAGWESLGGIARAVQHLLPSAVDYHYDHRFVDTLHKQLNTLQDIAGHKAQDYEAANPKGYNLLNKLMADSTQHRFSDTKSWDEHTHLHNEKNVAELAQKFKTFQDELRSLKQMGGYEHFQALRAASDTRNYAKAAVPVYDTLRALFPNEDFGVHPGDAFRNDVNDLHHDVGAARDFWKGTADRLADVLQKKIDKINGLAEPIKKTDLDQYKLYQRDKHDLTDAASELNAVRQRQSQFPTFHLGRDGDFYVSAHVKMEGQGDDARVPAASLDKLQKLLNKNQLGGIRLQGDPRKSQIFMRLDTRENMSKLHDLLTSEYRDQGVLDTNEALRQGSLDMPSGLKGMVPQFMERAYKNMLSDEFWDEHSSDVKGQVAANLRMAIMDMYSQDSLTRQSQHRENIPGFQRDMVKNELQRAKIDNNAIAKLSYQPRITEHYAKMKAELQALGASGKPGKSNDVMAAQNAMHELAERMQQRPWRVQNGIVNAMRSWAHTYLISMSPAYFLEVEGQNATLLLPELAKRHGFMTAASTIAKMTRPSFTLMRQIAKCGDGKNIVVDRKALMEQGVGADVAKFLVDLSNRGGLDMGSYTFDQTNGAGALKGSAEKYRQMANKATSFMELFARIHAAMAARELHMNDTRTNKGELTDYVDHVIDKSQKRWGAEENPRQVSPHGFLGKASPLMLTFTGYRTRLIEDLFQEMKWALGRSKDPNATPEAQAQKQLEAQRFLAAHAAACTIIGGTLGLPGAAMFAGAFTKIANTLTQSDDYDLEASYRRFLTGVFGHEVSEVLAKGAPRALGVDMSHLGEGDILPFTGLITDRRKFEDASADWAKQMAGAPVGLAFSMIASGRDMYNGNYLQSAQRFLPSVLKNPFQAFRMSQFGYQNSQNVALPMKPDAADVLMQALGLSPADKAEYDEKERTLQGEKEDRAFYSSNIMKNLATAYERGNPEDVSNMMTKAQEWDKGHVFSQILPTLSSVLGKRQKETAEAHALGTPLGVSIKNPAERELTGW